MYHLHQFAVCCSVVWSTRTLLCNPSPELSSFYKAETLHPWNKVSPLPLHSPQPLTTTILLSMSLCQSNILTGHYKGSLRPGEEGHCVKVSKQGCSKWEQNESLIRVVRALLYASYSTVLSLSFLSSMRHLVQGRIPTASCVSQVSLSLGKMYHLVHKVTGNIWGKG